MLRFKKFNVPFASRFKKQGCKTDVGTWGGGQRFRKSVVSDAVHESPKLLRLTLNLLLESADCCPPLKSVLGSLVFITETVQES